MNQRSFWKSEYASDLILENIYRAIARILVSWFSFLPLSANLITLLRVPLGLLIFLLLVFSGGKLLLFALIIFWKLLDKVDGAWAREKNLTSKTGAWFDIVVDRLFWGLVLLGITFAVYIDSPTLLPWILLFLLLLGNSLFQNFSFLGEGMGLDDKSKVKWSREAKGFKQNKFLFQLVFSIYYLWDQVLAVALLLYIPIANWFSISSLLLWLGLYAVFFNGAFVYVLYLQFKKLSSK